MYLIDIKTVQENTCLKKVTIHKNLEERSGNLKKNVYILSQVIINYLRQKNAAETCIQQIYATY